MRTKNVRYCIYRCVTVSQGWHMLGVDGRNQQGCLGQYFPGTLYYNSTFTNKVISATIILLLSCISTQRTIKMKH